ncbi:ankyrin repeat-containing protein At5g02620-like [Setaria italica]|uniref:ankyrin repeat-containing protein At5g02620-like n=1 Tax=Setaria italica TaxID=4555 RepID=UPI000BE6001F|nr:ankyrin repeat-containing protein At5g02620-like [Setaria italica]
MEQTVAFGPHFMTLDQELLRVLTAGDAARLEELLRRQDQTHSHVAVNVQAAAAPPGAVAAPPWQGASCLLLGVTSNGALHLAASRGHAELAALRCERAPSLVATRNRGLDTPLHCAAKAGHRGVVARLLSAMRAGGEALCARNCLSATALFEAVRHGHAAVVDLLMVLAPELASVATNSGVSPLYLAATTDSLQMVRALLRPSRRNAVARVVFWSGGTHCSACCGKSLILKGSQFSTRNGSRNAGLGA